MNPVSAMFPSTIWTGPLNDTKDIDAKEPAGGTIEGLTEVMASGGIDLCVRVQDVRIAIAESIRAIDGD